MSGLAHSWGSTVGIRWEGPEQAHRGREGDLANGVDVRSVQRGSVRSRVSGLLVRVLGADHTPAPIESPGSSRAGTQRSVHAPTTTTQSFAGWSTMGCMEVCPELVGRMDETARLDSALERTGSSGAPWVVLVHGEAGIGKTRLVEEFVVQTDASVLNVACTEVGSRVPFGALTESLRSRGGDLQPPPALPVGLGSRAAREESKRCFHQELVDAVVAAFDRAANRILVIEDLHWCDDAELEWIPYLVRTVAGPLLVVGTFRDEHPSPTLTGCLTDLDRLHVTSDLALGPLAQPDSVRLVELIADAEPAEITEIARVSGGNPLFAEELCKLGARSAPNPAVRPPLPRVVDAAFQDRSRSLSKRTMDALWAVATLGRPFTIETLAALIPQGDSADAAVDELVEAGLIVSPGPARFAFRHVLFQAAALESMPPSQRAAMHRRVAVALQSGIAGRPELRAAELLHHWSRVGDLQGVRTWALAACERALAAHLPADARTHANVGIDMLVRERGEAPYELLRLRGEAHAWMGDFDLAELDHHAALNLARINKSPDDLWRSLVDLGALSVEHDFMQAGEYFDEALATVRETADEHGLAESQAWMGFWHMMDGDPESALTHQLDALEILDRLGDDRSAGEVLDLLGWTNYTRSDLVSSRDAYRRGIAVNRRVGSVRALVSCEAGYATRGADCLQLDSPWCGGEPLAWAADGRAAVEHARAIGWRSGEARASIWLGLHLTALGDYQQALDYAHRGVEIAATDRQVRYEATGHILYAAVHLDVLDPTSAIRHADTAWRLANELQSPTVAATAASFLARAQIELGALAAATSSLERVGEVAPNSMPGRLIASAAVELALARGDFAGALRGTEALRDSAPDAGPGHVIPRLSFQRGLALSGLEYHEQADAALAEAANGAKKLRQRPLLWRILIAAGDVTGRLGGAMTASDCYRSAQRVVAELAGMVGDHDVESAFRTAASARVPAPTGPMRGGAGLTAREREVAAFVAAGMANREIAEHFVLSVRTVEKHVANALMKLHMRSRVELAVWAADQAT